MVDCVIPLIPDLCRIVLEYSAFEDRKKWDFPEDTGPIHDKVNISNRGYTTKWLDRNRNRIYNGIIDDETILPSIPNLQTLDLSNNGYRYHEDIDFSMTPRLSSLKLCSVTGMISSLSELPLTTLTLSQMYSPVDMSNMQNLTKLTATDCMRPVYLQGSLKLKYINILTYAYFINLANLICLTNCRLSGNLTNVRELTDCINLVHLDICFNVHMDSSEVLDLSKCPNLTTLRLDYYNKELDLSKNTKLRVVRIGKRFNQTLDVSENPNLENLHLGIGFNNTLCLCNNPKLKRLRLDNYYGHKLNLTKCPDLTYVYLGRIGFRLPDDITVVLATKSKVKVCGKFIKYIQCIYEI